MRSFVRHSLRRALGASAVALAVAAPAPAQDEPRFVDRPITGTVSWNDLEAGYVEVKIIDLDTFVWTIASTAPGGGAAFGPEKTSVTFTTPPYTGAGERLQALVYVTTGGALFTAGTSEPGLQVELFRPELSLPDDAAVHFALDFGLGRVAGTVGCFPGSDVTGGRIHLTHSRDLPDGGTFYANAIGEIDPDGTYAVAAPSLRLDAFNGRATTTAGEFRLPFIDVFGQEVPRGGTLTIDFPATLTTHIAGRASWHAFVAGAGRVHGSMGSSHLRLSADGLSGTFDAYGFAGWPSFFEVELSSCEDIDDLGCGAVAPHSRLVFSPGEAPAADGGATVDFEGALPLDYNPGLVQGTVTVAGGTLAGGTVLLESLTNDNVRWRTLVEVGSDGTYSAVLGEGNGYVTLEARVAECPSLQRVNYAIFVREGVTVHQDLEVAVSTADPGAIEWTAGVAGFPSDTLYFLFASTQGNVFDCWGSSRFVGFSATGPRSETFSGLSAGAWTVNGGAMFSSFDSGFEERHAFTFLDRPIVVAPGAATPVDMRVESPATLRAEVAGWDLGPADRLEIAATAFLMAPVGPGGAPFELARADATTIAAGAPPEALPLRLILDADEAGWTWGYLFASATYFYPDGGFSTSARFALEIQGSPLGPLVPGEQPLPHAELIDQAVGRWTVTTLPPPPEGASFLYQHWSGGGGGLFGGATAGFGGPLRAKLAPGRYEGGYSEFSDVHGFTTPLVVELGAHDEVVLDTISSPFISAVEPAPGTVCDDDGDEPCTRCRRRHHPPRGRGPRCDGDGSVEVTATVADPDGIATVEIEGLPVAIGADGAVRSVVPLQFGDNAVEIVARDATGDATSHTRHYRRTAELEGFLEPIDAKLVPAGAVSLPPRPEKATKLGKAAKLKLRVMDCCGAVERDLGAYPHPPRIRRIERVGDEVEIPLDTVDDDVDEGAEGIEFEWQSGIWIYSLPTTPLGAGSFLLTVEGPDGRLWEVSW